MPSRHKSRERALQILFSWDARKQPVDDAINAYFMLYEPEKLVARAGQGVRQGFGDAGPLKL